MLDKKFSLTKLQHSFLQPYLHLFMYKFLFLCCIFFIACKDEKKTPNFPPDLRVTKVQEEIPDNIKQLILLSSKDTANKELQFQVVISLDSFGLHNEALYKLDKLIVSDSFNNSFWLKRGQICKVIGDTTAAIKAFRYAAKVYPTPIALMELANLYAEAKNPLTLSICRQLVEMNPTGDYDAQANLLVGIYYNNIGDKAKALEFYNKSIAQDFHFTDAYMEKGYLLYTEKKYAEALKNFQQLSQLNQTFAYGYYWQGKCYEALTDKVNATKFYERSIQLDTSIKEANTAITRLKQ